MTSALLSNKRIRSILTIILFGFISMIAIIGYLFYQHSIKNFESNELMKLKGISNAVSLQIDGDLHSVLSQTYPNKDDIFFNGQDSTYLKIHTILKNNYDANMLKSPIYTLIKSEDGSHYDFGVTSHDLPYYRHIYKSFPPELLEMYSTGGMLEPYKDEFGEWLTAFNAIKNSKGETVALLMVDEKFSNFEARITRQITNSMLLAIAIFTLMYGLIAYLLIQILNRENNDKVKLQEAKESISFTKDELSKANEKLLGINTLRKEMIANLSHDLRTPLSTTIGYLELVLDQPSLSSTKQIEYLTIAQSEATRLKNMVSDLFELSKLEAGQITLQPIPFNIMELISDVTQKYKYQLEAKHIELFHQVDTEVLVEADIKYIERLFQNLLDNAIRYVYEGGFIKISILNSNDDKVKVKVCNIGDPINEEDRLVIFDRYFKSGSKSGTGLGLAIAKKICELHSCNIALDVNDNINSFYFELPMYKIN